MKNFKVWELGIGQIEPFPGGEGVRHLGGRTQLEGEGLILWIGTVERRMHPMFDLVIPV